MTESQQKGERCSRLECGDLGGGGSQTSRPPEGLRLVPTQQLLNCIMDMVEKTRRSLTVLRRCQEADREELNHWIRRYSNAEDMKKGSNPAPRPHNSAASVETPTLGTNPREASVSMLKGGGAVATHFHSWQPDPLPPCCCATGAVPL